MRKEHQQLQKIITIVGPTASGKTDWSLKLAKKYDGDIISADSRQIYKKMDIGTAKTEGEWLWKTSWRGLRHSYYVDGIVHHLIDFLDPGKTFTVTDFRDRAMKYIKLAYKHGRIPFVVGGTGLYVEALVDNWQIPRIKPNNKLRRSFEDKTIDELLILLERMDPVARKKIDPKNKRRLIRAIEVCILSGKPFSEQRKKGAQLYHSLELAIDVPREILYDRINKRVDQMIERGLLEEIQKLLKQKYSWQLPSMSGIGYKQFQAYFDGSASLSECTERLKRDTRRLARRQLTWFRRNKKIHWCQSIDEVDAHIDAFLSQT